MKTKYELPEYYPWKDHYNKMIESAEKIIERVKRENPSGGGGVKLYKYPSRLFNLFNP